MTFHQSCVKIESHDFLLARTAIEDLTAAKLRQSDSNVVAWIYASL